MASSAQVIGGRGNNIFTLTNGHGMEVRIAEYGATILSIRVRDRAGNMDNVVLGFDRIADYIATPRYFGAVVGRYGNRIALGRFTLDDTTYELATNNPPNHLHGGIRGFDKVRWTGTSFTRPGAIGVTLRYTALDGEEGYPGTLSAQVTYSVVNDDWLIVEYEATTTAPTPINLTQHSFFNLAGAVSGDVLDHKVTIHASHFTPVDATTIPTGEIAPVAGTSFDLRSPVRIGDGLATNDQQIGLQRGYDHNFVLDRTGPGLVHAARLSEPTTGRTMDVHTTEPGLQFYTGNNLDGSAIGREGRPYTQYSGLCLETQHFPDSPNQPSFPSTILRPGQVYRSRTEFRFGVGR